MRISLGLLGMLSAIELDDQARFHTTKVGDVGANRMLSAKLRPGKLAATHVTPQGHFSTPANRCGERGDRPFVSSEPICG